MAGIVNYGIVVCVPRPFRTVLLCLLPVSTWTWHVNAEQVQELWAGRCARVLCCCELALLLFHCDLVPRLNTQHRARVFVCVCVPVCACVY